MSDPHLDDQRDGGRPADPLDAITHERLVALHPDAAVWLGHRAAPDAVAGLPRPDGVPRDHRGDLGDITYRGSDGPTQDLDPPTRDQPVEIPGILKISIGDSRHRSSANGLQRRPTASRAPHPHRHHRRPRAPAARLGTGVKHGLFFGRAVGTETRSDDLLLRTVLSRC